MAEAEAELERKFQNEASIFTKRGDSWHLRIDRSIKPHRPNDGWFQHLDNTSAWFQCGVCNRRWPSNCVNVIFHMRLKNNKGVVKARLFGQRCNQGHAAMEKPRIDPDNIDILLENLLNEIRAMIYNEDLVARREANRLEVRSLHEPGNCQGCQQGICGGSSFP